MPHQCTNCGRTFADGSKEMLSGCPDCAGTKFQFRPDGFDADGGDVEGAGDTGDAGDDIGSDAPDTTAVADSFDSDPAGDAVSRTVGSAAATVRDLVGGSAGTDTAATPPGVTAESPDSDDELADDGVDDDDDIIVAESEPLEESDAQADARTQLVESDELPDSDGSDSSTDESDSAADDDPSTKPAGGTAESNESDRSVADAPDAERTDRPELAELREELNEQFESIRVVEPGQYELNLMELYDREEYIIALQEDGRYSIQMPDTWRDAEI